MLDEAGLAQPQFMVMLVLWERNPRAIREMTSTLHLDHGTSTPPLAVGGCRAPPTRAAADCGGERHRAPPAGEGGRRGRVSRSSETTADAGSMRGG